MTNFYSQKSDRIILHSVELFSSHGSFYFTIGKQIGWYEFFLVKTFEITLTVVYLHRF